MSAIAFPVFLFFRGQMIVTDKTEMRRWAEPEALKDLAAFDAAGRRLAVALAADSVRVGPPEAAPDHAEELKNRIAQFWRDSGGPIVGMDELTLAQAVEKSVRWLQNREWKTYRRGGRLFWTLMVPAALVPFAIGFFKLRLDGKALAVYSACFLAAAAVIAALRRLLYAKPPFPEPK